MSWSRTPAPAHRLSRITAMQLQTSRLLLKAAVERVKMVSLSHNYLKETIEKELVLQKMVQTFQELNPVSDIN